MRTSLAIFALAALCIGQDAFAQAAPKNVVVVDGQIAVSNLPASQTVNGTVSVDNLPAVQDVWVQGASNPVPVIDVTAPKGEPFFSTRTDGNTPDSVRTLGLDIPDGKLFVLKLASVFINGHANVVPRCHIFMSNGPAILHFFELTTNRFTISDSAQIYGTAQWSDLPPVNSMQFRCVLSRADESEHTKVTTMQVSWFGYLYDAPMP